ncbi:MAG TPA: hypothetical protein VMW58_02140 [Anaerolineae bacterium]|nr:hypothetical protein [Anaerolineae bacterium]
MTSYETVAVLTVMAMWFIVLILVASEAIQAIIRAWKGEETVVTLDESRIAWIERSE